MLTDPAHDGRTYNLHGEALSQSELVAYLNRAFGTDLAYRPMSIADYRAERSEELGDFPAAPIEVAAGTEALEESLTAVELGPGTA